MKVLQLNSYYIGNKLHRKLFSTMGEKSVHQTIYIPIKKKELLNRNYVESSQLDFHYDLILKKYDRFLYKGKIKKQMKRIEMKVPNLSSFDIIHAHTLFSDGGTAYLLKKKYGLDYIVSVRSADIYAFYKYAIHHRPFIHKVLTNASKVVFISHAYKKQSFDVLPKKVVEAIEEKSLIVPNGIENKWFKNIPAKRNYDAKDSLRILFTGSLDQNKNLETVLLLVNELRNDGVKVELNVAGDGPLREEVTTKRNQLKLQDVVNFHGNVSIERLRELTDQSDIFILPSYKETFGISYVEAMSRGLPIIYTRGEGIDGFFPEGAVGYATDPYDEDEMKENIKRIQADYDEISKRCVKESKRFNWNDIANEWIQLYQSSQK